MRVAELCAGYGGLGMSMLAAEWPVELAWYAENDPDASAVMASHHDAPNLGDIAIVDWTTAEPVDILAAGYPCQSFSHAGKRKGFDDERAVWPHVADAIRDLRPRLVLLENVAGHLARGFGRVLGDLAEIGYDATWMCLRASDIGAPHRRDRVFILAEPVRIDGESLRQQLVALGACDRTPVAGPDRPNVGGLMPTPGARLGDDRRGAPSDQLAAQRMDSGRRNLDDAVALLPTPSARDSGRGSGYTDEPGRPLSETVHRLLPTPRVSDSDKAGPNQRGSAGDVALMGALALLPTPTVADSRNTRNATAGRKDDSAHHDGWTLCDVAYAGRWGQYQDAIQRWETTLDREAPPPTVPGKRGGPQLSHHFVEWMIGLPQGYVTDVLDRKAALRVLGNGLVPQQGAVAYSSLAAATA